MKNLSSGTFMIPTMIFVGHFLGRATEPHLPSPVGSEVDPDVRDAAGASRIHGIGPLGCREDSMHHQSPGCHDNGNWDTLPRGENEPKGDHGSPDVWPSRCCN